ncbi:MAG: 50S ribosomal protein L13 [Kiritimatiellia bacterium]
MTKSFVAKKEEVQHKWYLVDATDKPAGRLAVKLADLLRGKGKPTFTPSVDCGDFVVVINAEKVRLTGSKETQKIYKKFTRYVDGLKLKNAATIRAKDPTRIIEQAVKGMLPKNKLSDQIIKKLKVYAGTKHPHEGQHPETIEL